MCGMQLDDFFKPTLDSGNYLSEVIDYNLFFIQSFPQSAVTQTCNHTRYYYNVRTRICTYVVVVPWGQRKTVSNMPRDHRATQLYFYELPCVYIYVEHYLMLLPNFYFVFH